MIRVEVVSKTGVVVEDRFLCDNEKIGAEWFRASQANGVWKDCTSRYKEVDAVAIELKEKTRAEAAKYLSEFNAEKYDPADIGEIIEAILLVQGLK